MPVEIAKYLGNNKHICKNCGHTGSDVEPQIFYVGGQGHIRDYYCIDTKACWQRVESKQRKEK